MNSKIYRKLLEYKCLYVSFFTGLVECILSDFVNCPHKHIKSDRAFVESTRENVVQMHGRYDGS